MLIGRLLASARLLLYLHLVPLILLGVGLTARSFIESNKKLSFPADGSAHIARTVPTLPQMGVTVRLELLPQHERVVHLKQLREQGFLWVRQRFDWAKIEPKQGSFQWQLVDEFMQEIFDAELEPVVLLDNSPLWARADKDRDSAHAVAIAPPADPRDMARFASAFAARYTQRYANQVRTYQIWDEPNIAPHWGNRHIEPVEYARLLAAVGGAIRAVDADAFILTGSLAPTADRGHTAIDEIYFLRRLYAATELSTGPSAQLFDGVAIQPFGFGYAPTHPRRQKEVLNFQRAALIRRVMVDAGNADGTIWAMRFGWSRPLVGEAPSSWPVVSPDLQKDYTKEAIEHSAIHWPWLTHMGWPVGYPLSPAETKASNDLYGLIDEPPGFDLTDELVVALTSGQGSGELTALERALERAPEAQHPLARLWPPLGSSLAQVLGLLAATMIIGWRSRAALRILPWQEWLSAYRQVHHMVHVVVLATIAFGYYQTTWPPLLLLWISGAVLAFLANPRHGLILAALLIPFDFQHKEIAIVNWVVAIGPAHMAVLCLLPAYGFGRHFPYPLAHEGVLAGPTNRIFGRDDVQRSIWFTDWLALGWLLLGLCTVANSWHRPAYVEGLVDLVLMPLLLYMGLRLFATQKEHYCTIAGAFMAGGVVVALIGLAQWFQGAGTEADGVRRLVGTHFSPNHTALYLERTLFVGVGLLLGRRQLWAADKLAERLLRLTLLTAIGTILVAILLTASRGALLVGLPAGLLVLYLAWIRRESPRQIHPETPMNPIFSRLARFGQWAQSARLLLTIGGLAGLASMILLFWERLSNSGTIIRRLHIWEASLQLWLEYPWLGVGPGGFFWRYPAYILETPLLDPNLRHPHNVWLEVGTMMGVLGLMWLLFLLVWGWSALARPRLYSKNRADDQPGWLALGLLAGLAAGLAHGQVDAFWALADLAAANWLMMGLVGAAMADANRGDL